MVKGREGTEERSLTVFMEARSSSQIFLLLASALISVLCSLVSWYRGCLDSEGDSPVLSAS